MISEANLRFKILKFHSNKVLVSVAIFKREYHALEQNEGTENPVVEVLKEAPLFGSVRTKISSIK